MAEDNTNTNTTLSEKTYTQADIDALTTAKNKERDAANAANARVKELEKSLLDLQSKTYGDEEKIKNSPLYKNLELTMAQMKTQLDEANSSLKACKDRIDENELAKELSKNEKLLPTAVDDVIAHMRASGFVKTEKGWLGSDGKSIDSFVEELYKSKPHYFKRSVGASQPYFTKEKLKEMGNASPRQMLTEIFS